MQVTKAITNVKVKQLSGIRFDSVPEALLNSEEPILLKGLVSQWPLVQQSNLSDGQAVEYLKTFYQDKTVVVYRASPQKQGRFFYSEDCKQLDFNSGYFRLDDFLEQLLATSTNSAADTLYVGSTTVDVCLPGLRRENDLAINHLNPLVSIWIGNQTRVAAHFDGPQNVACCVAGRRRFTVFPPQALPYLYTGPLDFTPSGQIISMVDFNAVDFDKFPLFAKAVGMASVAEMEPGDALILPSMWWHHVESFASFNILINYWWRDVARYIGAPMTALHAAIMCIRDLPEREKTGWRELFEHYVFSDQIDKYQHIPAGARGFLEPMNEISSRRLRAWLLNKLNQ